MVTSDKPLIKHGRITASDSYKELLKFDGDPNRSYFLRDITIKFSAVAGDPYILVEINGEPKLRDFRPVHVETKLSFGGDLVFHGKSQRPPIVIKVKDASGTPDVTAVITGVETPLVPIIGKEEDGFRRM